jgi:hypothetical protein
VFFFNRIEANSLYNSSSSNLGATSNQIAATVVAASLQYTQSLFSMTVTRMGLLRIGRQELAPFVHSAQGRALLALPGADVEFLSGAITPRQVLSARPSYINAILIQSRGGEGRVCSHCRIRLYPFPYCRRTTHFRGCCANCKWRDWGARCTWLDDDDEQDGNTPGGIGGSRTPLLLTSRDSGNTSSNPIIID